MGNLNSQFRCLGLHLAIMADGASRGVPFNDKDRQTLSSRAKSEGSSFLYVTLPNFGKAVDQGLVGGCFTAIPGFSLKRKTRLPNFLYSCLRQVFGDDGSLLEAPNTETIFYLRQFLLINSKLVTKFTEDQQDAVVKEFSERQARLKRARLPKDHFVLLCAQNALRKALRHLDLSSITPGHGPGVVHEGYPQDERWDFKYWPSQANKLYPYDEYGVQSLEHLRIKSNSVLFLSEMTTRICLVPKDFKGPRLISVEMSSNQYLQQGQMRSMMAYFDRSRLLSLSIKLRNQMYSQERARTALADDMSTLDLSNASDTVTASLVWFLLAKIPRLRRQLFSTRSRFATWKGAKIRLAAFAPMGSATCFPVETLVFWSLAIGSLALHRYGRQAVKLGFRDLLDLGRQVVVFGDDIIVPTDCLPTLMATLQEVGCEPNMSKTCWRTPFRESCGSEWFNGIDVTIIRNKEYPYDQSRKFSHFPDLQNLQRRLFVAGLRKSAELVLGWANEIAPVVLCKLPSQLAGLSVSTGRLRDYDRKCILEESFPYPSSDVERNFTPEMDSFGKALRLLGRYDSVCFWDDDLIDSRLQLRWNHFLQRTEFRTPVLFQRYRDWGLVYDHFGDDKPGTSFREKSRACLSNYPRLMARLSNDSSDRIPIRGSNTKIGWRQMPSGSYGIVSVVGLVSI
jgi:hypothetical protein